MAKLQIVEKPPVPVPPCDYVLTLTLEEILTLKAILRKVGGCPHKSLRKFSQSICDSIPNSIGWYDVPLGNGTINLDLAIDSVAVVHA